jgi:hypothetical protein
VFFGVGFEAYLLKLGFPGKARAFLAMGGPVTGRPPRRRIEGLRVRRPADPVVDWLALQEFEIGSMP